MPQASDTDRKHYTEHFGFPDIGCEHAIELLQLRGYELTPEWTWVPSKMTTSLKDDLFLIGFLIDEWDFGGWAEPSAQPSGEGTEQ